MLKIQLDICNGCHDVLMMSMNLSNSAILNIHVIDYCCVTNENGNSEAINLLQSADLNKKIRTLQNIVFPYQI